ncbi:MAG: anthranilate phosphoribosyltransferase [bacterium]|nr:anthranilate phosphoribosyltransferase [bacterium]
MDLIRKKLYEGEDLSFEESRVIIGQIMRGELDPVVISAILMAFKIKGEKAQEIGGAAGAMLKVARALPTQRDDLLDVVGTGGDGFHSINISTAAAIVLAAAGVSVAKHGNRAVSSRAGSSDVLAELGVKIDLTPEVGGKVLDEVGITFLYAPVYHPAMKYVAPVRQHLGTRTLFNILGPLCNPARPQSIVLGVYSPDLLEVMATALLDLGMEHAFVIHGAGMDELALHGPTQIIAVSGGGLRSLEVDPGMLGIEGADPTELKGGDAGQNAHLLREILGGRETGAMARAVALNAAAGLVLKGIADDWARAYRTTFDLLASGEPEKLLDRWAQATQDLS